MITTPQLPFRDWWYLVEQEFKLMRTPQYPANGYEYMWSWFLGHSPRDFATMWTNEQTKPGTFK